MPKSANDNEKDPTVAQVENYLEELLAKRTEYIRRLTADKPNEQFGKQFDEQEATAADAELAKIDSDIQLARVALAHMRSETHKS